MIILDLGSGNTCRNDFHIIKELINSVKEHDTGKQDIVMKFQLFQNAPPNLPLSLDTFEFAYNYGKAKGYEVTDSVFDEPSLRFLETFDVPFIKIACVPHLYFLKHLTHKDVIRSYPSSGSIVMSDDVDYLCCVREYPAKVGVYQHRFFPDQLVTGISDHTKGFLLYELYKPRLYEKHYVLERNESNPDAGVFAAVPDDLKEIL